MNVFFVCLLISISLSMDAFSLALIYGTYGLSFRKQVLLSLIVSLFHFFMPIIGVLFGNIIINNLILNSNWIVGVIFGIIGIEMVLSFRKSSEVKLLSSLLGFFLFGFTVSIDSLTTGIGLSLVTNEYMIVCLMFMVSSGLFTFLGLLIGDKLNKNLGRYSCFVGGIFMIILGVYYLFFI